MRRIAHPNRKCLWFTLFIWCPDCEIHAFASTLFPPYPTPFSIDERYRDPLPCSGESVFLGIINDSKGIFVFGKNLKFVAITDWRLIQLLRELLVKIVLIRAEAVPACTSTVCRLLHRYTRLVWNLSRRTVT